MAIASVYQELREAAGLPTRCGRRPYEPIEVEDELKEIIKQANAILADLKPVADTYEDTVGTLYDQLEGMIRSYANYEHMCACVLTTEFVWDVDPCDFSGLRKRLDDEIDKKISLIRRVKRNRHNAVERDKLCRKASKDALSDQRPPVHPNRIQERWGEIMERFGVECKEGPEWKIKASMARQTVDAVLKRPRSKSLPAGGREQVRTQIHEWLEILNAIHQKLSRLETQWPLSPVGVLSIESVASVIKELQVLEASPPCRLPDGPTFEDVRKGLKTMGLLTIEDETQLKCVSEAWRYIGRCCGRYDQLVRG